MFYCFLKWQFVIIMQQHFLKKLINKNTFYILKKPHFEFVFFLFWGKKSGNSSWCCSLVTDFLESLLVRHSHTELLMEWQHLSVSSYLDRFHLQEKSKKERKGSKDTVRSKDASSIRSKGNVLHTSRFSLFWYRSPDRFAMNTCWFGHF